MKQSFFLTCLLALGLMASANNMLVQNVTTLGNDPVNKTIQVQFDISWDNSWRDSINYDAAWIFIKFKDANGLWQHAKLNQTGFNLGTGTADSIKVTADKVGSWIYRSTLGSGTFSCIGVQLQWNYGLSGLTTVTGLEVQVFAIEMVYVPEGDFNMIRYFDTPASNSGGWCGGGSSSFAAPGDNFAVINRKLSPSLYYQFYDIVNCWNYNSIQSGTLRVKGDAGIDTNNDGIVDNATYPTGYRSFYTYKYELTEQQYSDFLNTLTSVQVSTLGIAGANIYTSNGKYLSRAPNSACINPQVPIMDNSSMGCNCLIGLDLKRLFAYADWSGQRPISFLEFSKAHCGPFQPGYSYPYSYYGQLDLMQGLADPVVKINAYNFNTTNGDGVLQVNGISDVSVWLDNMIMFITAWGGDGNSIPFGFRYCRSTE